MLGILRTYLFSHTTNRIDVELGARLFRHLLALPIAYFQARRVGDSVARVRELENIRNFLTSSALTLVIDLFFTVVFIAVMFLYSPLLTWIVLGSLPLYIAISAGATPLFRRRLDEKFRRGAENQAFLVESVTGVETLKAMAVEPQMQRRWEEQLAGYVAASFRVLSLGNVASQTVQLISKLVTAAILYFGAKLVIEGDLTRRRAGRLQHAGRPRQPAGPAAGPDLAGLPPGAALGRAPGRHPQHAARAGLQPGRTALPAIRGDVAFEHVTFRYRIDGPEVLHDVNLKVPAGQVDRHRRPLGLGQEHARQAGAAALRARERPRAGRRRRPRPGRSGLAAPPDRRRAAGERAVQPLGPRQHRARRSRRCRSSGSSRRRSLPARTSSSSSCPRATTPSSASAAAACRAASASASPSPAR